jgi:hypothetical protein
MTKWHHIWNEFWTDESHYYGDLKACALYLSFTGFQLVFVLTACHWMDKI